MISKPNSFSFKVLKKVKRRFNYELIRKINLLRHSFFWKSIILKFHLFIFEKIVQSEVKQIILVMDLKVYPIMNYGEPFNLFMIARYFKLHSKEIKIFIINDEVSEILNGRYNEKCFDKWVKDVCEMSEVILDGIAPILIPFNKLKALRKQEPDSIILFYFHVLFRFDYFSHCTNICNSLIYYESKKEFNKLLFRKPFKKLPIQIQEKKYISWHIRRNPNDISNVKYSSANIEEDEFDLILRLLIRHFKDTQIVIVSDITGCKEAKIWAKKHKNLELIFSKDISSSFISDANLVLGSLAYFQFLPGGMSFIGFYSTVPFLISYIKPTSADLFLGYPEKLWFRKDQLFNPCVKDSEFSRKKLFETLDCSFEEFSKLKFSSQCTSDYLR